MSRTIARLCQPRGVSSCSLPGAAEGWSGVSIDIPCRPLRLVTGPEPHWARLPGGGWGITVLPAVRPGDPRHRVPPPPSAQRALTSTGYHPFDPSSFTRSEKLSQEAVWPPRRWTKIDKRFICPNKLMRRCLVALSRATSLLPGRRQRPATPAPDTPAGMLGTCAMCCPCAARSRYPRPSCGGASPGRVDLEGRA